MGGGCRTGEGRGLHWLVGQGYWGMRLRGSVAMLWRNCWTKLLAHEPRLALADDVDGVTDVGAKGGIVGLEATKEVVT